MRFGVGVDRAAYLGYPQLHAPVSQLGEDVLDLTGGAEGSLWFADDDAGPAAIGIGELGDEPSRLGAPGPGDGPRDVGVVDDGDDLGPADDEGAGPGELPAQTFARVLLVVGGRPGVGGERNERLLARSCDPLWVVRPAGRARPGRAAPGQRPARSSWSVEGEPQR